MRGSNASEGLTWDDLPALLLTAVSAITVTTGAGLLRGQSAALMLLLGAGVAGATFVLDRLLVQRLNSIRPRQSLPGLLLCWAPLFLFSTALATLATFSWIAPEIARRDLDEARRQHWTGETDRISAYVVALTAALRKQTEVTQAEIDGERRRASAARRDGTTYPAEESPRAAAQARRDARPRATTPGDAAAADRSPARRRRHGHPGGRVSRCRRRARQRRFNADRAAGASEPPAVHRAANRSAKRGDGGNAQATWRALSAWGAALWVEVLPLLALWRGGRKASLAARVLQWRSRITDTADALRGRHTPAALPIVIEPLQVRGIVRVAAPNDYTLTDCAPLLDEAIGALTAVLGSYELHRISNARGDSVDEGAPLLPQLNGQPLVLSVQECHS